MKCRGRAQWCPACDSGWGFLVPSKCPQQAHAVGEGPSAGKTQGRTCDSLLTMGRHEGTGLTSPFTPTPTSYGETQGWWQA